MIDINYFISVLWKRKWLIVSTAALAAITAFVIISLQPKKYEATTLISTGIVDYKGVDPEDGLPFFQKFQIDINYSNLIRFIQSYSNVSLLSYRLVLHDLEALDKGESPFVVPEFEDDIYPLSDEEKDLLASQLQEKIDSLEIGFEDYAWEQKFRKLAEGYGYDQETILKDHLKVSKMGQSDYISIGYVSEDPWLSHYAVNQFCEDFLRNRKSLKSKEATTKVEFLNSLVKEKQKLLDRKKGLLKEYKENLELVDLPSQQEVIVNQIKDLETDFEREKQKVPALTETVRQLNQYLGATEKASEVDAAIQELTNHSALIPLRKEISDVKFQYKKAQSENSSQELLSSLETRIKDLEGQRDAILNGLAAQIISESGLQEDDVRSTYKELFIKRIQAEFDLIQAQQSVGDFEKELERLRKKALSFVSAESYTQNLEDEIDLLKKEYEALQSSLNDAMVTLEKSYQALSVFETAQVPDKPLSARRMVTSVFAGIVGGALCIFFLLVSMFLDNSLRTAEQFSILTDLPLIGKFPKVQDSNFDVRALFETQTEEPRLNALKEGLRDLRFRIEESGSRAFLFVSTQAREGKTFSLLSLAYALSIQGRKILIIDANFKNNSLSRMVFSEVTSKKVRQKLIGKDNFDTDLIPQNLRQNFHFDNIDIIGNQGSHLSPAEIFAGKDMALFFNRMRENYDYIFIESADMNSYADAKEITPYVDKIIAVFSTQSKMGIPDRSSIAYLKQLQERFLGAILNRMELSNLK